MTPEPQDVKPLPCPFFCNGVGRVKSFGRRFAVRCEVCGATGPARADWDEAIAEWNRRTPSPPTGGASSLLDVMARRMALGRLEGLTQVREGVDKSFSSLRAQIEALRKEHNTDSCHFYMNGEVCDCGTLTFNRALDAVLALCGDAHGGGTASDRYVIWSGEHSSWWGPDSSGYTPSILGAGLYSREDAERVTEMCGPEKEITIRSLEDALGFPRDGTAGQLLLALVESEGSSGAPST